MTESAIEFVENVRFGGASLLGPGDPEPFGVINPHGQAGLVLICDHASRAIPAALDDLALDETVLCRHIAWDIGALEVARRLAARFDAPLVHAGFSRLVVDPNRALDDPTSIPVISDGVVVPGNRDLSEAARRRRVTACFQPYHDAVSAVLDDRLAGGRVPALVSIHSFTPVFKGHERPWHFGILWNRDPRLAVPLMAALAQRPDVIVGDNKPYSGRDDYGYSIEVHAERHGLPHVLIEIRQDLIDTPPGAEDWATELGDALARCLDGDPDLSRVARF